MHFLGVRTVVRHSIYPGHILSEVGLEGVDTQVNQDMEVRGVPGTSGQVGKFDDAHTWLPIVPLPNVAGPAADEIACRSGLCEEGRLLGDIGVDSDADVHIEAGLQVGDHLLGGGSDGRIEGKVAETEATHPEGVLRDD